MKFNTAVFNFRRAAVCDGRDETLLFFRLTTCLSLAGNSGHLTWISKAAIGAALPIHALAITAARAVFAFTKTLAQQYLLLAFPSSGQRCQHLLHATLCNASDLFKTAPVCQLRVCSCAVITAAWKGFAIGCVCVCVCVPLCTVYMFMRVQCNVYYVYACMCACVQCSLCLCMYVCAYVQCLLCLCLYVCTCV